MTEQNVIILVISSVAIISIVIAYIIGYVIGKSDAIIEIMEEETKIVEDDTIEMKLDQEQL